MNETTDEIMQLRVMQQDIRGALRNSGTSCPLARAILRENPGNQIQVFDQEINVNGAQFLHTLDSREFAQAWNDGPVRPCVVKVPDFTQALI